MIKPYEIREFRPEDVDALEGCIEGLCLRDMSENIKMGPCYTGLYEGQVMGFGGVRILWEGVGDAWLVLSPEVKNQPREAIVYVRQTLEDIIQKHKLFRVQAIVRRDFFYGMRFVRHLGFEVEGILRSYVEGKDCYMYSRIVQ